MHIHAVKFKSLLGNAFRPTTASLLPAGLLHRSTKFPLILQFLWYAFPAFTNLPYHPILHGFFGEKANTFQVILISFLCFGLLLLSTLLCFYLDAQLYVGDVFQLLRGVHFQRRDLYCANYASEVYVTFNTYALGLSLTSCFFMQLAWTCYNFYQSTPTKLAGENYFFHPGQVSLELL